jgi:hypothetical protein
MTYKYFGYISAIKNGESDTRPVCVSAESPGDAFSILIDVVHLAFPKENGYCWHATSSDDGLFLLDEEAD